MTDIFSSEVRSKIMSRIRSKDTQPELLLRKALRRAGYTGYRLHWKSVPGKPDIVFVGRKVAIFIHGCFWHRCPICNPSLPKSNTDFWKRKFEYNVKRYKMQKKELKEIGWKVFTFWECQIKENPGKCGMEVIEYLMRVD